MAESKHNPKRTKKRRRRLGQYFTPADVARFACAMLPRLGRMPQAPRVIDPACGEGVFVKAVADTGIAAPRDIIGCDVDPTLAETWQDSSPVAMHNIDGLTDRPDLGIETGGFDLVTGNPPFGFDGRRRPRKEIAFLHRFIRLARPGGRIVVILPEGVFANVRLQGMRDELLGRIRLQAVIELPENTFSGEQAAARTAMLFAERGLSRDTDSVLIGRICDGWSGEAASAPSEAVDISSSDLRGERWDPRWWLWPDRETLAGCRWPVKRLGNFIEHITYGPIVTGRKPEPVEKGVVVINQKQLRPTGIALDGALTVAEGSDFDPPRARVQKDDLLFARCGAGSLPQGKLVVVEHDLKATVSCFVDVIRLSGIEPRYAAAFLKGRYGLGQIKRTLNGVGTPNISFAEIKALRIPVPPEKFQGKVNRIWRRMTRQGNAEAERSLQEAILLVENAIAAQTRTES